MLSPHSSTHSISPALSISPSPCVFSVLFQRNHSQLCFSSVFPDFLTQGVSQQMFRLAKIPNSRCLAKIKTNREKKTELPRPKEPSSVELQLLPLAQGCPAADRTAPPGREGMGHDRVAQIWSLRQAGRGENTS